MKRSKQNKMKYNIYHWRRKKSTKKRNAGARAFAKRGKRRPDVKWCKKVGVPELRTPSNLLC